MEPMSFEVLGFGPPQQQQQHMNMHYQSRKLASPPAQLAFTRDYSSPVSCSETESTTGSGETSGYSPNGWSTGSHTDSSTFSSPPTDDCGANEWDLLSDMLLDDSITSATIGASLIPGPVPAQVYQPPYMYEPQQQQQAHQGFHEPAQQQQSRPTTSLQALYAAPPPAPAAIVRAASAMAPAPYAHQMQRPAIPSRVAQPSNQRAAAPPRVHAVTPKDEVSTPEQQQQAEPEVKLEELSPSEQKKIRRRTQIASSVQRHREKKKNLVTSLKHDLAALTSHLAMLRSQRKFMHANDRMVEWEEEAITQRRKRKQSEEVNERMKKALFQQTVFLRGMHSMITGLPAPRELEFHDWIHSYTVLGAHDLAARRREYQALFSESKLDLSSKIVCRETDVITAKLSAKNPYYAQVRVLHDGTNEVVDEADVYIKREVNDVDAVALSNGQVMKKYTFIFVFEEQTVGSFDQFIETCFQSMKSVGVFWPAERYSSRVQDAIETSDSRIYYSDLTASMDVVDDRKDSDCMFEARMLATVTKRSEDEGLIVWDYADKDEVYPLTAGQDSNRSSVVQRNSCGAVVVRREPGGLISMRSVTIKIFAPLGAKTQSETKNSAVESENAAIVNRRIALQASDYDQANSRCIKFAYGAMLDAIAATNSPASSPSSSSSAS